jgi:DnaK suppressor protein
MSGMDQYKQALAAKAAAISQSVRNRRPLEIEHTAEACEQTVFASEREMAVLALERDSRVLREVRLALDKLEDGSYGTCESCEEAISAKRLNAVPWTRHCVQCQERIDRDSGTAPGNPAWLNPRAA